MTAQPYIRPNYTEPIPGGLNLAQFLQTVFVGITGLSGTLVRPKWQQEPPKQPDIDTNWLAMGVDVVSPDANAYVDVDGNGRTVTQRHEDLDVSCSIYGPDALEIYGLIRDGLQIQTNLEALRFANMGFIEVGPGRHIPDLVNERWFNRIVTNVFFRREIQRRYPIVTILSASGTIHTVTGGETYLLDWAAQP
jgi:hypothetical protein